MTKKHYKAIAEIIRTATSKKEVAIRLAEFFQQDNQRFNQQKFFDACLCLDLDKNI